MKVRTHISLCLFCLALALTLGSAVQADQLTGFQQSQIAADEYYESGNYEKAYKKYVSLARKGDSFSQYRLSYMNFQGQGVDQDWDEAFAWALLAAQGNNPELVKYLGALTREMPEEYATTATRKAKAYMDRWGNIALAEDAARGVKRELRACTGSRLGRRCEEVYALQMPRFWNVAYAGESVDNPGSTGGFVSSDIGHEPGGAVLNTRYYQGLRWGIRDIEQYIMNTATNVEIGDLETIDDQ